MRNNVFQCLKPLYSNSFKTLETWLWQLLQNKSCIIPSYSWECRSMDWSQVWLNCWDPLFLKLISDSSTWTYLVTRPNPVFLLCLYTCYMDTLPRVLQKECWLDMCGRKVQWAGGLKEVERCKLHTFMWYGPAKSWMVPSLVTMPKWPIGGISQVRPGIGHQTMHEGKWSLFGLSGSVICFSPSIRFPSSASSGVLSRV